MQSHWRCRVKASRAGSRGRERRGAAARVWAMRGRTTGTGAKLARRCRPRHVLLCGRGAWLAQQARGGRSREMDVFRHEAVILLGGDAHTLEQHECLVLELLILFEQREIVQTQTLQLGVVFVIFAA